MQNIKKNFGGVQALKGVDFELKPGEVHALLGENGAGKSTLMKILQGVYTPSEGSIQVSEKAVTFQSPQEARQNGIEMVFQEFSLVPTLSVSQNIFLGREPKYQTRLLNDREAEELTRQIFARMNVSIDPRQIVARLSTGLQQLAEIAKALSHDAKVLILDEPTSSLTHTETLTLFEIIKNLKAQGIAIVYISHRMEEIFQIVDRITVLRDGNHIITDEASNLTIESVIEHIVGHRPEATLAYQPRKGSTQKNAALTVANVTCQSIVKSVSFELYPGEVLGVAGLMGSGRTELVQALFGVNPIVAGSIALRGNLVDLTSSEQAVQAGIALIPEDRRRQGLVLGHSVRDNILLPLITLGRLKQPSSFVDDSQGNKLVRNLVEQLRIRLSSINAPVRSLSGGNQQKVVISKWLSINPDILLMDEPTAGVDIGTKSEIVAMIRELADQGKAIVVVSSELSELLAVSDRILVMRDGTIRQELAREDIQREEDLHQIIQQEDI